MELRHIRYLIASAEEENFGRAAERLNVTRSAVSQIIADLEEEIGVVLFDRQAQKIKLTPAGRVMLPGLQSLIRDLGKTISLGQLVGKGRSGILTVGYGSLTTHHPLFRSAIKQFYEECPDVFVSLVETPTSIQNKSMHDGLIDAGFMHMDLADANPLYMNREGRSDLCNFVLEESSVGLIVPHQHPLARQSSVCLADLEKQPFVMPHNSRTSPAFGPFFKRCQTLGIDIHIVQEVSSTGIQQDLIAVGVGIGVSVVGGGHSYPPELICLPLRDMDCRISFQVNWLRSRQSPALSRFIDVVRSVHQSHSKDLPASVTASRFD